MHKLLLGIAASALLASGAIAHETVPIPVPVEPAYSSAGFDWDGFYMGLGITGLALNAGVNAGMADVIAGVNITSGDVLFGLEGWIGGFTTSVPTSGYDLGVEARLGYLVAPEAVIYLSGGGVLFATSGGGTATYGTLGAGAEFALSDNVSLDLEYKYWVRSVGGVTGNSLGGSLNWGF